MTIISYQPTLSYNENSGRTSYYFEFRFATDIHHQRACRSNNIQNSFDYTTLMQAFDLLYDEQEWKELSNNNTDFNKCDLAWIQIFGPLMDGLPHIGRFGFARAFDDDKRTLSYKYDPDNSFPDASSDGGLTGLGFDFAIYGGTAAALFISLLEGDLADFRLHVEQQLQTCRTYAAKPSASASSQTHSDDASTKLPSGKA